MSAAAFLRFKKLKGAAIIRAAARHNRRDIQAELGADSHIYPERTHLNQTLQGAATSDDVAKLAKDLMRGAGIGKLRKDAVLGIEAVFSLPIGAEIDDTAYFTDCATWAGVYFGGAQNILSVDIHRDEAAPHCHILILPIDSNNRMNGGRMLALKTYPEWQTIFYKEVAARYGLRKPLTRLSGESKQTAVKAVIQKLREGADAALNSKVWATIREAIESNPAPFLMALGLVIDKPKKPLKTMAAIFTGKGKGGNKQNDNGLKSIDFAPPKKHRSLCSVDFAQKQSIEKVKESDELETVRVRESENDPAYFNPETGEFMEAPKQTRSNREAADGWVKEALRMRGCG